MFVELFYMASVAYIRDHTAYANTCAALDPTPSIYATDFELNGLLYFCLLWHCCCTTFL